MADRAIRSASRRHNTQALPAAAPYRAPHGRTAIAAPPRRTLRDATGDRPRGRRRTASRSARSRARPASARPRRCAMSLLVFTGASQFAFIGVLAAGGGALAAIVPAACWRCGTGSTASRWRRSSPGRCAAARAVAQLVIDETTAMARAQADPATARRAFLATGISVFVCWNAGTLAVGAARQRDRRPARARPRRDVPGGVPGAARRRSCAGRARRSAAIAGALIAVVARAVRPGRRADRRRRRRASRPCACSPRTARAQHDLAARSACSPRSRSASRPSGPSSSATASSARGPPRSLDLLPVPMLAALIVVRTLGAATAHVDARLPALAVAARPVWRRAPFLVVISRPRRPPPCCAPRSTRLEVVGVLVALPVGHLRQSASQRSSS